MHQMAMTAHVGGRAGGFTEAVGTGRRWFTWYGDPVTALEIWFV